MYHFYVLNHSFLFIVSWSYVLILSAIVVIINTFFIIVIVVALHPLVTEHHDRQI